MKSISISVAGAWCLFQNKVCWGAPLTRLPDLLGASRRINILHVKKHHVFLFPSLFLGSQRESSHKSYHATLFTLLHCGVLPQWLPVCLAQEKKMRAWKWEINVFRCWGREISETFLFLQCLFLFLKPCWFCGTTRSWDILIFMCHSKLFPFRNVSPCASQHCNLGPYGLNTPVFGKKGIWGHITCIFYIGVSW